MANIIIKVLEWNRSQYNSSKRVVMDDSGPGDLEYDIFGLAMVIFSSIYGVLIGVVSIVLLPFALLSGIINFPYYLYRIIAKHPYFVKNYIKRSLVRYEKLLNSKPVFKLKHVTHEKYLEHSDENLKVFLENFFKRYNECYYTVHEDRFKVISRQCAARKRRSVGDVYQICRHYFKDVTLDEVLKTLIELISDGKLGVSKCSDIRKYVFVVKHSYIGVYMDKELDFIEGITFKQLVSYYEKY